MTQYSYHYGPSSRSVTATELSLEDMLRGKEIMSRPTVYHVVDDMLPKPILIAFNYEPYEIKYIAAEYSEEILALDNMYIGVNSLTDEQVEIITELGNQEPLETVDLSLYSKLVTLGWLY